MSFSYGEVPLQTPTVFAEVIEKLIPLSLKLIDHALSTVKKHVISKIVFFIYFHLFLPLYTRSKMTTNG